MTNPDTSRKAFEKEYGHHPEDFGNTSRHDYIAFNRGWNASRADILALLGSEDVVEKVSTSIHEILVKTEFTQYMAMRSDIPEVIAKAALAAITQMIKGE